MGYEKQHGLTISTRDVIPTNKEVDKKDVEKFVEKFEKQKKLKEEYDKE
jgi:hypothetical protein